MHQLERRSIRARCGKFIAYVVLDGFHIMICAPLNRFDDFRGIAWWLLGKLTRAFEHARGDLGGCLQAGRHFQGEMQQPLGLDLDAFNNQGGFTKVCS